MVRTRIRNRLALTASVVTAAIVTACGQAFDPSLVTQVSDATAPAITITSPGEGSSYASVVLVEGTVSDAVTPDGDPGRAISVSYEVLSTTISGSAPVSDDGGFSFSFETTGLSGSLTLRVSATDWNGNSREAFRTLLAEGAVPSFAATASSRTVTLTWDDVPLATSYAVRYAGTGRVPTETSGILLDNVASPLTVEGLENGESYSFILEARHSDDLSSFSEIRSAIPLSRFTLVPHVEPGFRRINVSWQSVPGASRYELLRATSPDGPFLPITGATQATRFADTAVSADTRYYYSVRPEGDRSVASAPSPGTASPFPGEPIEFLGAAAGIFNTGRAIAVEGDRAYVGWFGAFFSPWADLAVYDVSVPNAPVLLGSVRLTASSVPVIQDVEVTGSTVILSTAQGRLFVVDAADQAAMTVTTVSGYSDTRAVAVDGVDAYVADGAGGLLKVPAATMDPTGAPTLAAGDAFLDVEIRGGQAYVAGGTAGLSIVDLSSFPTAVNVPFAGDAVSAVTVVGDYAYVTLGPGSTNPGLAIVDVSTPSSPVVAGRVATTVEGVDVTVTRGRAFVSAGAAGVAIIDVNDADNPALVAEPGIPEETTDAEAVGDVLYTVGLNSTSLSTYGVNAYPQPVAGESFAATDGSLQTVVNGVVVTASSDELQFLDESTGALLEAIPARPDFQFFVARAHGDHVFVTSADGGALDDARLDAIRVLGPNDIVQVGTIELNNIVFVPVLHGDYAFLAGYNTVLVVDVSDPGAMELAGFEPFQSSALWATLEDTTLYIAGSDTLQTSFSLVSIDVSDPRSPAFLDSISLADLPNWIGVRDGTAFVALDDGSLEIADVGDPAALNLIGNLAVSGSALLSGTIVDTYLYLTGSSTFIVDVADPGEPAPIAEWQVSPDSPIHVSGSRVLFTSGGNLRRARLAGP